MTSPAEERATWDARASEAWFADGGGIGPMMRRWVFGDDDVDGGSDRSMASIVPAIGSRIRPGARVLDLGCGPGRLTNRVARLCPSAEVVGVDVSPVMVDLACDAPGRAANATYLVGNGRDVDGLGPFDAAFSMLLFQHLDPDAVRGYLRSVAGELRPRAPFRFQWAWIAGGDDAPYHHLHRRLDVYGWCDEVGVPCDPSEPDPAEATWLWATARRRSPSRPPVPERPSPAVAEP